MAEFNAATIKARTESVQKKQENEKQEEITKIMAIIEDFITVKSEEGLTEFVFKDQDEIFKGCNFAKHHVDVAKILRDEGGFSIEGIKTNRTNPNYGFKVIL